MAKFWDRIEQTLVGLLGLCAMGVGMWQILGRYLDSSLNSGWGDEIIIYLLIWSIMIVSSQLVRHDGHVRPDIVLRMLPAGGQRWLEVLNCLAAIGFLGGMVWYGWAIVQTGWMLDERSQTELGFPMYLYYLALPVGSALMVVRYCIRLGRYLFAFDPATMTIGHAMHDVPADMMQPASKGQ